MKISFSITIIGSYTSENNCRRESTGLLCDINGLAWLIYLLWFTSFAEPIFPFGWVLCNTSIYCMLTFWLSCTNYGEFPLLHIPLQDIFTYALFWYSELICPLKTSFPIILSRSIETNVSWNQSSYAMTVPLTFIIFFCEGNNTFSLNETHFPLIKFIGIGA